MSKISQCKVVSLLFSAVVAGCGGGGGSDAPSSSTAPPANNSPVSGNPSTPGGTPPTETEPAPPPSPTPVPDSTPMTMSCVDGAAWQCSGGSILRSENGVALTRSGVQVYGKSTSDLLVPNPSETGAFGLALASGGVAEVRVNKGGDGYISQAALLLSKLDLSWDARTERPPIIETFNPTQGRVVLDSQGAISFVPLPPSNDLAFYDYAVRNTSGTQSNYANNRYFPRTGNPSRCTPPSATCPTIETIGLKNARPAIPDDRADTRGDWREGGFKPDGADAGRLHEDGDIHAGDALPGSNPPWLAGGTGYGVPYPGAKGYRALDLWSFQYANLASWITQDTVQIGEWGALDEHNKNRRGMAAFGAVTDPAAVPATGSASYSGIAYGRYSRDAAAEPAFFSGPATVTVNFVSREVIVTIANTVTTDAPVTAVPVALRAVTSMGATGTSSANYMTGPVDNGTLTGGLSGRHFGPVVATGSSGRGPEEIGGAFSLSNAATGAVAIGGFIARKQ